MPFTVSHVAAAVPLRGHSWLPLPFAAIAAGCMSPDLPYYVSVLGSFRSATHTPLGAVTISVVFGLLMWAAWRAIAPGLFAVAPGWVRERWSPPGWATFAWWSPVVGVCLGAITHVIWDEFTHAGRFGTAHFGVLTATFPSAFGPWEGYRYAQYLSGAFGLFVLGFVALRLPPRAVAPPPYPLVTRWVPPATAVAMLGGAALNVALAGGVSIGMRAMVFQGITGAVSAGCVLVALVCLWAQYRRSRTTPLAAPGDT